MTSNLATLRSSFARVGYTPELLEEGRITEAGAPISWCAGYALLPQTARNACVAAIEAANPATVEQVLKLTGAPIALVLDGAEVTVMQQSVGGVTKTDVVPLQEFADLTDRARTFIDPRSIHRAKTLGRFDASYQLTFIDVGLLPQIERAQGEDLRRLLERIVAALRLPSDKLTNEQRHQVLTIAFWILAARMLRDHGVPDFVKLNADGRSVLQAIARHYGGAVPILAAHKKWQPRVEAATALAWQFGGNLGKIGPEAIAYVNESSLIADQTRRDLGTHSTPPFIVEYVLGRLREAILAIPPSRRLVVEPACGHAAFLVAALRVLAEDVPADARHDYLRDHLRGLEIDHAAKELARLSLTVADVPNSDGWDLREGDMFEGDALANLAQGGTILLANPPFENFDEEERAWLAEASGEPVLLNKASEMLRRVLPALAPDAVIGVVMPRPFLSSDGDRALRSSILAKFELIEICVFPDHVFRFSDHECAVILARGAIGGTKRNTPVVFRRVREAGMAGFREGARVSTEEVVPGSIFLDRPEAELALPELRRIWSARGWSTLTDIAFVKQGLSYHGWVRESGHETIRDHAFAGSVPGVAGSEKSAGTLITDDPPYNHMDATPEHIRRTMGGLPQHTPQVVLNTHPHARGPWRLMAFVEPLGAAVPSTRIAVRPRDASVSVETLWAICNSMMANAFVYAHLGKRDITTGTLGRLPIPAMSGGFGDELTSMVRTLFAESRKLDRDDERLRELLTRIDVAVLGAYGLFAPAEQQLLSLFDGHVRPGLPYHVTSVGTRSRLPQYLDVSDVVPTLPTPAALGRFSLLSDLDAEIDDGHRELAALRRTAGSSDSRVAARIQYVRDTVRALQEHAAEAWILPEPITH